MEAQPRPTRTAAGFVRLVVAAHEVRPGDLARHRRRRSPSPSPRCARRTGTRPTRRSGSRCSTTRPRWARRRRSRAASNIGFAFNWFYVNSDRRGVLHLRGEPGPARRRRPEPADAGRPGLRVGGLEPGPQHRARTGARQPTRSRSTRTTTSAGTTSRPRTTARRTATSASAPVHRADLLDAPDHRRPWRPGEVRPGRLTVQVMAEAAASPTCAATRSCPTCSG